MTVIQPPKTLPLPCPKCGKPLVAHLPHDQRRRPEVTCGGRLRKHHFYMNRYGELEAA